MSDYQAERQIAELHEELDEAVELIRHLMKRPSCNAEGLSSCPWCGVVARAEALLARLDGGES